MTKTYSWTNEIEKDSILYTALRCDQNPREVKIVKTVGEEVTEEIITNFKQYWLDLINK